MPHLLKDDPESGGIDALKYFGKLAAEMYSPPIQNTEELL